MSEQKEEKCSEKCNEGIDCKDCNCCTDCKCSEDGTCQDCNCCDKCKCNKDNKSNIKKTKKINRTKEINVDQEAIIEKVIKEAMDLIKEWSNEQFGSFKDWFQLGSEIEKMIGKLGNDNQIDKILCHVGFLKNHEIQAINRRKFSMTIKRHRQHFYWPCQTNGAWRNEQCHPRN